MDDDDDNNNNNNNNNNNKHFSQFHFICRLALVKKETRPTNQNFGMGITALAAQAARTTSR
jgi:hypothetical protein